MARPNLTAKLLRAQDGERSTRGSLVYWSSYMLNNVRNAFTSASKLVSSKDDSRGHLPRFRRPESVQIKARKVAFRFDGSLPKYWGDNDPFLTAFMNALSLIFPDGERMFMDAVKAVRSQVQDPGTRRDIAGFMGQEALHSLAHEGLNAHIRSLGYPSHKLEQHLRDSIAENRHHHTDKSLLALTCALEHVTAIMGDLLLRRQDIQDLMHPEARPIWLWHALEETEHKAVAFDVYQEIYGDYSTRALWLVFGTVGLLATAHSFQYYLLKHDGLANQPWLWARGMWRLWGKGGMLSSLIPTWLEYFKPGFHPWQHDNSQLIAGYRAMFEGTYSDKRSLAERTTHATSQPLVSADPHESAQANAPSLASA